MQTSLIAVAMLAVLTQAASAESWNCQLPSHVGVWQIDGGELLGPTGVRYPVVRDNADMLMGMSEGRRVEIVLLNRRSLVMQTQVLGLDGESGPRDVGRCTRADVGAAATGIRPLIRSLAQQAQNLASQGFTTAANLKLTEAEGERHVTAEETRLIAQVRAYIATKPRR